MTAYLIIVGLLVMSIAVLVGCAIVRSSQISEMERREGKE